MHTELMIKLFNDITPTMRSRPDRRRWLEFIADVDAAVSLAEASKLLANIHNLTLVEDRTSLRSDIEAIVRQRFTEWLDGYDVRTIALAEQEEQFRLEAIEREKAHVAKLSKEIEALGKTRWVFPIYGKTGFQNA